MKFLKSVCFIFSVAASFNSWADISAGSNASNVTQCTQANATLQSALSAAQTEAATDGAASAAGDESAAVTATACRLCATALTAATSPTAACTSAVDAASTGCMSDTAPQLLGIATLINGLTDVTGLSSSQVCAKTGGAMKTITGLITAYNVECGALQLRCASACQTTTPLTTSCGGCPSAKAFVVKLAAKDMTSCVTGCTSYKMQLAVGAIGAVEFLRNMAESNKCNDATTTDCTTVANASTAACYCTNNPTAAGCSTTAATVGATTTVPTTTSTGAVGAGTTAAAAAALPLGADGTSPDAVNPPAAASGNSATGSGGGGSAGGGLGGGASPSVKAATGADKSAATAEYGGGGSSSGGGSHGGGGYADTGVSPYAKFLPTAKKAGATSAAAAEVSAKAGKSNWDKVTDQYMSLRTGLLGQ